ncbi:MAG: class I SAM-dependent methyltransferase [Gemmatimonadales bacterium]
MTCCGASACETQFDRKRAARELKSYRAGGPANATTRALIQLLRRAGVQGSTLLDIGGGVGAIQYDLLEAGAREVTAVDASSAYQQAAREEAARRGVTARIQFRLGDFVALAAEIPTADIVTLDRVVCCYPDMEPLVRLSAERCRKVYGLSYPRYRWPVRVWVQIENFFRGLFGNPFRSFVHSPREMEGVLTALGFKLQSSVRTYGWEIATYEAPKSGPSLRTRNARDAKDLL